MTDINLSVEEFKKLSEEAQHEYLYFLTSYNETVHKLTGMEEGVKATARYKIDSSLKGIEAVRAKRGWTKKYLEEWELYQDIKEDLDKYKQRLERICKLVQ